jgi:type I restriction enzyme S subunit
MTPWQTRQLGQFGRVVTGKTPPTDQPQYFDGEDLFVSPRDMAWDQFYVNETQTRISRKALEKFKNQVIPKNTVMYTSLSFGFGKMGIASRQCLTNQQINSIIVNKENSFRFLFYLLKAYTPVLFSYNSGIDTPIVPKSVFERIEVKCPEFEVQHKIAGVLWTFDELLETNRRRQKLLERTEQELYREWFSRFRYPGRKGMNVTKGLPDGWEKKCLPEIADITYGFAFDGARFNPDGRGKPIIRIRNISDSTTVDFTDEKAKDKYIVRAGDLLIGMDGEFHMNHWCGDEAYLVQRVCRVKAKDPILEAYLALALRAPVKHYESILMGATVGHLGAIHLKNIEILVPPKSLRGQLTLFNDLLKQRMVIAQASRSIAAMRQKLLVRLLSERLSVDDVQITFPPSMTDEVNQNSRAMAHA